MAERGADAVEQWRLNRGPSKLPATCLASDELINEIRSNARAVFETCESGEVKDEYRYATLTCHNLDPMPLGVGFDTREGTIWVERIEPSGSRLGQLVQNGYQIAYVRRQGHALIYVPPGRMCDVLMIVRRPDKSMSLTTLGNIIPR